VFRREEAHGFRRGLVVGFYAVLVGGLAAGIYVAYPHILEQGKALLDRVGALSKAPSQGPGGSGGTPDMTWSREKVESPELRQGAGGSANPDMTWSREKVESLMEQLLGKDAFARFKKSSVYGPTVGATQNLLNAILPGMTKRIGRFFQDFLRWLLHFFLALLFSLIILLDLPKLREQVRTLEHSRVGEFYREIAPSLQSFGAILGKAFQAQAMIAVTNTVLTLAGILILGIPHPFLLSGIVFVCSFIPVLGVIISTIPIALFAVPVGGGMLVLYVVLWVAGVHAVEAYLLNPKIVGEFMRMHPVVVLVILVVAEHLFGLWGLLLGVPVCFYLYHHWIKGDDAEIARMPLRAARRGPSPT
jgi:predicted PurR-regulated permease PerM